MADPFADSLTSARKRAGLSRAELARAVGVSTSTVISWEMGRRRPGPRRHRDGRQLVIDISDALGLDIAERNQLLVDLGYPPVPDGSPARLLARRKPLRVIGQECASYSWPVLAMNEDFEIVGWNEAANLIAGLDIGRDLAEPGARHLLRMALSPAFHDKLVNWEDTIAIMVGIWKSAGADLSAPGTTTPYFQNLMQYVMTHHMADLPQLMALWQNAEPHVEGQRVEFRVLWQPEPGVQLTFDNQLTAWSEFDGVAAMDWHPADALTWRWLNVHRRTARRRRDQDTAIPGGNEPARTMLKNARISNGLSRRELSERSGLSESLIFQLEMRSMPLRRETILQLGRAMVLEYSSLNEILTGAGFEPVPSPLMAYILGHDASETPRFAHGNTGRRRWTPDAVSGYIEGYQWPALVVDDRCEVIAANSALARTLAIDLPRLDPGPERNLLSILTEPGFVERTIDWDAVILSVLPGNLEAYLAPPGDEARFEREGEYFSRVVDFVRAREEAAGRSDAILQRLFRAWRAAASSTPSSRIIFRFVWRQSTNKRLSFNGHITTWNAMLDPYWSIELHPANGATWDAVRRAKRTPP